MTVSRPTDPSFPINFIRREEGLPNGQVQDIAVDDTDRIWMATSSGLAIYDGSRCSVLDARDGLSTQGLRAVAISHDKQVLVGSDLGVDLVEPDFKVSPSHLETPGLVECICNFQRTSFIGTSRGLFRVHDGELVPYEDNKLLSDFVVALGHDRREKILWAICRSGSRLMKLENDTWLEPDSADYRQLGRLSCIESTVNEYMVVGGDFGFAEINKAGTILAQPVNFEPHGAVTALLYCEKCLWVAHGKQLSSFERKGDQWVLLDNVSLQSPVNKLCLDSLGSVWVATDGHGLGRISALANVIKRVNLPGLCSVFAISSLSPGRFLVAGNHCGWRIPYSNPDDAVSVNVLDTSVTWDILNHTDGYDYAATSTGLLQFTNDQTSKKIGLNHEVLSAPGRCLLSHGEDLLVGTQVGCAKLTKDFSVITIPAADGELLGYVYTMIEDRDGTVWIGTLGRGLWQLAGDHCVQVTGGGLTPRSNVYSISVRADNVLAIAQDDKIFTKSPDAEAEVLVRSSLSIAAWAVNWDQDGSLWAGTSNGLVHYNSEDGRPLRHVQALLGLSNWEFTTSRSLFMHERSIYCGLNSGLVQVDLDALLAIKRLPTVHINRINISGTEVQIDGNTSVVEPGFWELRAEVYSAWSLEQFSIRIHYRLLGFSDEWKETERTTNIQYNSLPEGRYYLEVRAYSPLVGFGPVSEVLRLRVQISEGLDGFWAPSRQRIKHLVSSGGSMLKHKRLLDQNAVLEKKLASSEADLRQTRKQIDYLILESSKKKFDGS